MGSNKTITLTVDVQAKLGDLQGEVGKIQQTLNKLNMPDNLAQSTKKGVDDLLNRIKKVQEYTEGNKLDVIDERKVQSELNAIQKDFARLVSTVNAKGSKITLGDPKIFNTLKNAISGYDKEINKATRSYEDQLRKVEALSERLENMKQGAPSIREEDQQKIKDAEKELEIAKKTYEEKKKEYDLEKQRQGQKGNFANSNEGKGYKAKIAEREAELAKITADAQENAQKEFNNAIKKTNEALETQKTKLGELKTILGQVKDDQLEKIKADLSEFETKNGISLGINLDEINTIEDLRNKFEELNETDLTNVNQLVKVLTDSCKQCVGAVEEIGEGVEKDNDAFKQFNSTLDGFRTKVQYVFGIANAFQLLKRAVSSAYNTIKDLDKVMTETAVVTNFSVSDMWEQLPDYTRRANELGVSIHDAYEAATLYYQQGLKTNEVIQVSNETLKMARIAGLGAAEATDRMTNALRGFNMEINEDNAQRVNDVYSKLAAITAADTDEISTAMTKVASLAHNANMEFETTSAFLSQMIETTRESAETAGTALKTVIARFSEVKKLYNQGDLMGTDEEGEEIDVNKVSQALRSAGINLNEYLTGAKGLDDIFIELAGKWQNLDMVQQRYIATMAAGSRQQSRFIAMMSDYKRTVELVDAANTSAGASQEQFSKTLESMQSKLAKLKNSWDTLMMGIVDNAFMKGAIDALTGLLNIINEFFAEVDKRSNSTIGSITRIGAAILLLRAGRVVFENLISKVGAYAKTLKMKTVVQEADVAAQKKDAAANLEHAGSEEIDKKATDQNTNAEKKNLKAKLASIGGSIKSAWANYKEAMAKYVNVTSTLELVAATGLLLLGIAAIVVIIVSLIRLFKEIKSRSPEEVFKRLEESARTAADAANEAAEAYSKLNSSLESLDDKYEALENMTRGSREWRDAVREINDEVLNLMTQYEGLRVINEGGVLKLANAEEISTKLSSTKSYTNTAQLGAQYAMVGSRQNVEYKNLLKEIPDLKSSFTLGQEELEKIAKEIYSGELSDREEISKRLNEEINVTDEVVKALVDYGKALSDSRAQMEAYQEALAAAAVSEANLVEGTETQSQSFMDANRFDSLYIEEFNAMEGMKFTDIKKELFGYIGDAAYEMSDESARTQLAYIKAQNKATTSVERFSKSFSKLDPIIQAIYSREDKLGLTKEQMATSDFDLSEWKKGGEFADAQAEQLQEEALRYWNDMPELQEIFGNFADFQADYVKAIVGSQSAFDRATEKIRELGLEVTDLESQLSGGELDDLADNLKNIYYASGTEGAKAVQSTIDSIVNEMDALPKSEFLTALNSVDWSNADQIEDLPEILSDLGISVPEDQLEELTSQMISLGAATYNVKLTDLIEQLDKFGGLAAKIASGEQGRTGFSKESMEAAVEAGISQSDFFYDVFSGTYTYIGEKLDDIKEALLNQTDSIVEIGKLEQQIANGEAFKELVEERGGKVDVSDSMELVGFLHEYASRSTDLDLDAVSAAQSKAFRTGDYGPLIDMYNKAAENADAVRENTIALKEANEHNKQTEQGFNSILGNAFANPILNAGVVTAQAAQAGVSSEVIGSNNIFGLAQVGTTYQTANTAGINSEEMEKYAEALKIVEDSLGDVVASQLALTNSRSTRGLKKLVDTYEDWTALIGEDGISLKDLDEEGVDTFNDLKDSINDLVGVTKDLSSEFYTSEENLDLLMRAVDGDNKAINELRVNAAKDIAINIKDDDAQNALEELYNYMLQLDGEQLEFGADLNLDVIDEAFKTLVTKAGMTAEQVQALFNTMGIDFELETKEVTLPFVGKVEIPVGIKKAKYGGTGGSGKKKDTSGGGSSKSEKTDTWENPFDELYNLTEKINEALRTREELERKYQKLLKNTASTVGEVSKAYYKQIEQLRYEADLQKQMQAGRARQIDNVLNETYTDSEGNRKTYAELGVGKYASYNKETGLLQIDWSALQALEGDPSKVEEGKAAEAYIKRLEELQQMYEEVRDKLWDIEDQIEQLREEAIDNYLSFEDRVMNALVSSYQKQIDQYKDLSDKIKEAEDEILNGLRDQIELSRQIRDNTKKEEDIAKKEARLAYLRRDTSGANALEIKKLEEEIANAREEYSDQLIDQQLDQMQKDSEAAQKQREKQIEIMQAQLDYAKENGELWQEVWDLMAGAVDSDGNFSQNSQLVQLLKEEEAYKSLSRVGQEKWWEEAAKAFKEAQVGLGEAEDKYGRDMNGDGSVSRGSIGGGSGVEPLPAAQPSTGGTGGGAGQTGSGHFANITHSPNQMTKSEIKELQMALNDAGFTDAAGNKLDVDGKYGPKTTQAVKKLQAALGGLDVDGRFGAKTRAAVMSSQWAAFKTGGLADFTGPAWMDGTSAHPELVLNAQDTENFIALKDILANLMSGQGGGLINGGDNYFDINISAEIGSDYDVTKLSEQIKKEIYNDSMYRNVNTISYRH